MFKLSIQTAVDLAQIEEWTGIRMYAKGSRALDAVSQTLKLIPDTITDELYDQLGEICKRAQQIARERIQSMPNKTKEDGRVKTGAMLRGLTYERRKYKGYVYIRFGWLNGPGYSLFQEWGTRRGLIGMNALMEAYNYLETEVAKLDITYKNVTRGGVR